MHKYMKLGHLWGESHGGHFPVHNSGHYIAYLLIEIYHVSTETTPKWQVENELQPLKQACSFL